MKSFKNHALKFGCFIFLINTLIVPLVVGIPFEFGINKIFLPPSPSNNSSSVQFSYDDGNTNEVIEYIYVPKNTSDGLDTNSSFFNGAVDFFKRHVKVIYPGTLWCGDGNKAKSETDLGTYEKTDRCCRDHDNCPDNIYPKEKRHELENNGLFTRSNCKCDQEFYGCLKNASTIASKQIGFTYFSILGPQCFKEDYKITGCIQFSRGKCILYRKDNTIKKYQWFDNPPY